MGKGGVGRHYTIDEIHAGLLAVAYHNGNTRKAGEQVDIPYRTLAGWKKKKAEQYEAIRAELLPRVAAEAAEKHSALADAEMEVSHQILARLRENVGELPARDLPGALRNTDTGAAINRDKAAQLREMTTEKAEMPDINATLRALQSAGVKNIRIDMVEDAPEEPAIEGTAEELPSGES